MIRCVLISLFFMAAVAKAQETIEWVHAHGAASAATPGYVLIIEEANRQQKKYNFVNVFKPGGDGKIAVDYVAERAANRLTSTTGAIADGLVSGRFEQAAWLPVQGLWDVCWAAATVSKMQPRELVIAAASSQGSLAHYIALGLMDKYHVDLTMVYFKSNTEGFINMAAGNGVTLAADRIKTIEDFQNRNSAIKILGLHCPQRHPKHLALPTLKELGIQLPPASVTVIAHRDMGNIKINELRQIFESAIRAVGSDRLWDIGDLRSPVFANIAPDQYHIEHMTALRLAQHKFARELAKTK